MSLYRGELTALSTNPKFIILFRKCSDIDVLEPLYVWGRMEAGRKTRKVPVVSH